MNFCSHRKRAQLEEDTYAIMFVGDDLRCKVQRRHFGRGTGEGNEVGERYDARGGWRKRPRGVISSSPGGSHLTDRLREVGGRRVGGEE